MCLVNCRIHDGYERIVGYKVLNKVGCRYQSIHHASYEYKIGEDQVNVAEGDPDYRTSDRGRSCHGGFLYMFKDYEDACYYRELAPFFGCGKPVVVKCEIPEGTDNVVVGEDIIYETYKGGLNQIKTAVAYASPVLKIIKVY